MKRIPLDRLVFLGNVPAGMDWSVIGYWVCQFRKTAEDGPPILLTPIGDTGLFRVTDGRHRTVASYIAGRTEIVYEIDPNRPAEQSMICKCPAPKENHLTCASS